MGKLYKYIISDEHPQSYKYCVQTQRVCKGHGLTHACKLKVKYPLFKAVILCSLVCLQDFCGMALLILLSEARSKLFEHCRHLSLKCSPAVSPKRQSHHHCFGLRSSNSAQKLSGYLITNCHCNTRKKLTVYKKTQQNTYCN